MTEKYEAISQHCMKAIASPAYHQLLLFLVSKSEDLEELDLLEEMIEQERNSSSYLEMNHYRAAQLIIFGNVNGNFPMELGLDLDSLEDEYDVSLNLAEHLYMGNYDEVIAGLGRIRDNILFGE